MIKITQIVEGDKMTMEQGQQNKEALNLIFELSLLYDFYGALLKEHKRTIFEDYVLNDYSLSEIASEQGMSRQGVHDIVKRCSKELERYEDALHLIEKFRQTKEHVNKIHMIAMDMKATNNISKVDEIENISNHILEML